jgi:hypothetical protein
MLELNIDDGNGGITTHSITINVVEKKKENFGLIVTILMVIVLAFLIIWGVFLRLQEKKQKRMLDSVGTNQPLEARTLTEKDFTKGSSPARRRGKKKDEGIPMPPAPIEVEGALAREEIPEIEEESEVSVEQDFESEVDDIVSELFS